MDSIKGRGSIFHEDASKENTLYHHCDVWIHKPAELLVQPVLRGVSRRCGELNVTAAQRETLSSQV